MSGSQSRVTQDSVRGLTNVGNVSRAFKVSLLPCQTNRFSIPCPEHHKSRIYAIIIVSTRSGIEEGKNSIARHVGISWSDITLAATLFPQPHASKTCPCSTQHLYFTLFSRSLPHSISSSDQTSNFHHQLRRLTLSYDNMPSYS